MKIFIVDAFTQSLFGGNPAGVVLVPYGEDFPKEKKMQLVAKELGYSETAFVKQKGDKEFHIRYFTPAAEVDLCGHATIGAFYALMEEGYVKEGDHCLNYTLAGTLNVMINKEMILMDMGKPEEIETFQKEAERKRLYGIMGLEYINQELPLLPKIISTGLKDIILPIKNREELNRISPDFKALSDYSKEKKVVGVHCFTMEEGIYTRNFAPLYDIDEEAATGTANGALSYYLYKYNLLKNGDITTIIQGEKMGRPSKIVTKIQDSDETCLIQVGGLGKTVIAGDLKI